MNAANAQRDAALLAELFAQNGVHQDIADYLTGKGCVSVANFANYVDEKKELRKEVLDHVDAWKNNNSMLAKLKQAWREAEAQTERALTRASAGRDIKHIDDPLPDGDTLTPPDASRPPAPTY